MRVKNEMQASAILWYQRWIRVVIEVLYRWVDGDKTFYPTKQLAWVKEFENHTEEIRNEFLQLVKDNIDIPNWESVSNDPSVRVGNDWKTFILKVYDQPITKNTERCPVTARLITKYPFIYTTWFSVLEAGKSLPFHRGPYNGVLRYHLGLIVPGEGKECKIQVGNDVRFWEEGKSLLFDDSHIHAVWNQTDKRCVVLFVDIERPLPFPFNYLNKWIINRIGKSEYVENIVKTLGA